MIQVRRSAPSTGTPPRPGAGRLLAGVCAGLSERFAVDVTLLRLAFLLLTLAWGLGLLIYGVLWFWMPDATAARGTDRPLRSRLRRRFGDVRTIPRHLRRSWQVTGARPWPRPLSRRWLAGLLVLCGTLGLLTSMGVLDWLTPVRAVALSVLCVGMAGLFSLRLPKEDRP